MISIDAVLNNKLPHLFQKHPVAKKNLSRFLKFLCHESEFHQFNKKYPHLQGFDFVEQALEHFEFDYRVFEREIERIPAQGRCVMVSNHPIGSLDGLALLKLVSNIRSDVRIVANDLLYSIEPLKPLLFPVDNLTNKTRKDSIKNIRQWLENDGAIIIFPAGEVSRFGPSGIKDGRWNSGFIRFANNTNSPILPIFINGRNSIFFYALSLLNKPISTLWLIREMFKQANQHIDIRIGHQVHPEQFQSLDLSFDARAKQFRKYVYKLGKGKSLLGFTPDYDAVAHPQDQYEVLQELSACELLGETCDGKKIYLYRYHPDSIVMKEIGRLRELSFRAVKEGSGKRRDIDRFDSYYDHIVLWDEKEMDIVGAYRMLRTNSSDIEKTDQPRLYTQTLFDFQPCFTDKLAYGLELGRSFVQPKYWGKRSLDYLWYGIGAYLRKYPDIRYMFGPVSLSHAYSSKSKNALVYFYSRFFASEKQYVLAPNEFYISKTERHRLDTAFHECDDYAGRLKTLKTLMKSYHESIPALFKQYTELCDEGGTTFSAFNIDHEFSDCIDGFILVDVNKIKTHKKNRYIEIPAVSSDIHVDETNVSN